MYETRLNDSIGDAEIEISGYNVIRLDRNRQGWIILYIRDSVTHSIVTEIVNDIELLCININLKRQKPLCLVVWYRPPNAPMKSFDEFEIALQYLDAKSIDYTVIGDLNCDVTKTMPSGQTSRLLNIIADYGLKSLCQSQQELHHFLPQLLTFCFLLTMNMCSIVM